MTALVEASFLSDKGKRQYLQLLNRRIKMLSKPRA